MKRRNSYFLYRLLLLTALIMLVVGAVMPSGVALADTEETEYEHNNNTGAGNETAYSSTMLSQSFTVKIPHTVSTIRLPITRTGNPYNITVSVRASDGSGLPTGDDLVISDTYDSDYFSTDMTWREFDVGPIRLEANTTYCIVLVADHADSVTNYIEWEYSSNNASLFGTATAGNSTDGGTTWGALSGDFKFEVWGEPVLAIWSAEVYNDYMEDDDYLFVFEYLNICPPHYDDYDTPEQHFNVRLILLDDSVKAVTPCRRWGDRPGSIYIAADEAAALELNSAYTIEIYGTGYEAGNYTLTSADWKGADYTLLDQWMISTAQSMEDYHGETYTDTTENNLVLNKDGGAHFIIGVPYINEKRPDMFLVLADSYDLAMSGGTIGIGEEWETAMGSTFVASMESAGNLLGTTGQEAAAVVIIGIFAGCILIGALMGNAAFGLVLALPVLIFGGWVGVVSLPGIAILILTLTILFVAWFWWQVV